MRVEVRRVPDRAPVTDAGGEAPAGASGKVEEAEAAGDDSGVTAEAEPATVTVDAEAVRMCNAALVGTDEAATEAAAGLDDLTTLGHLHEPAILQVLQLRYAQDVIYTFTGRILLAVNPFQRLPLCVSIDATRHVCCIADAE